MLLQFGDVHINVLGHHQVYGIDVVAVHSRSAGPKSCSMDVPLRYSPIPLGIGILHLHSMLGCDMKVF